MKCWTCASEFPVLFATHQYKTLSFPRSIQTVEEFEQLEAAHTIRLGLERMRLLCKKLGDPQKSFRAIHVAGTNGKGSICAMLHAVLLESGLDAGLYTSPHLVTALERVRLGSRDWTPRELLGTVNDALNAIHDDPELSADPPTTFELITAAAFLAIRRAGIPVAVIEVGLGGRLDSTNVCEPVISVISSIGLDHQAFLGPGLIDIAGEKAGIIRPRIPVVSSALQPEVQRLLQDRASELGSACYLGGRQFDYVRTADDRFDYLGLQTRWPDLPLPLPGRHQFQNAAAACAALELLNQNGFAISPAQVRAGFGRVNWPGRLEHVSERPDLWLDGAHNPAAAQVLAAFLQGLPADRKLHLIVAFKADKQQREYLEIVAPLAHRITVTTAKGLSSAEEVGRIARSLHSNVVVEPDPAKILAQLYWRKPADETAVLTGSLYLVGAAKRWLNENRPGQ